jgi:hypothetical protein
MLRARRRVGNGGCSRRRAPDDGSAASAGGYGAAAAQIAGARSRMVRHRCAGGLACVIGCCGTRERVTRTRRRVPRHASMGWRVCVAGLPVTRPRMAAMRTSVLRYRRAGPRVRAAGCAGTGRWVRHHPAARCARPDGDAQPSPRRCRSTAGRTHGSPRVRARRWAGGFAVTAGESLAITRSVEFNLGFIG